MLSRTAVLAAVVSLALPAAAGARAHHRMHHARTPLARAIEAATAYWHDPRPCAGQVSVRFATSAFLPAGETYATATTTAAGEEGPPSAYRACRITFELPPHREWWSSATEWEREDWTIFCAMMVHEFGHLEGHWDNTTDPRSSITYPWIGPWNDHLPACQHRHP